MEFDDGVNLKILAPVARGRKGTHMDTLARIKREGFVRRRIDGLVAEIKGVYALDKNKRHPRLGPGVA